MSQNIRKRNTGRKEYRPKERIPFKENCCYSCRATLVPGHILVVEALDGSIVGICPACYKELTR